MTQGENTEYRIAHLREKLASEDIAELGVRIEMRGAAVLLSGTVSTMACRDEILRIAETELTGLSVLDDLTVAHSNAPDGPEELA
ncbi:hypothetical protein [Streptomyces sp. SYSU K217416]